MTANLQKITAPPKGGLRKGRVILGPREGELVLPEKEAKAWAKPDAHPPFTSDHAVLVVREATEEGGFLGLFGLLEHVAAEAMRRRNQAREGLAVVFPVDAQAPGCRGVTQQLTALEQEYTLAMATQQLTALEQEYTLAMATVIERAVRLGAERNGWESTLQALQGMVRKSV